VFKKNTGENPSAFKKKYLKGWKAL
jgi:hypothetical protein